MISTIEKRLTQATKLCASSGARLTPIRKTLLTLIYKQTEPLTAYELLRLLREKQPKAEAMTVYRALDFLQQNSLVHRIASNNSFTACESPHHHHYAQLLVCENCGITQEIESKSLYKSLQDTAKQHHFTLSTKSIEITGLCSSCQ